MRWCHRWQTVTVMVAARAGHHLLALADPLAGEGAGADGEEGRADVGRNGPPDQRLPRARRPKQQQALGRRTRALHAI